MTQSKIHFSEQAIAINTQLVESIIEKITRSGGSISFADFMHSALYEPDLGYYQNVLQTFGEEGDFVTAPEISNLFAKAVAESLAELAEQSLGLINIMEIGAGQGTFAFDLMGELASRALRVRYHILEPSARLQGVQREKLSPLSTLPNVEIDWLSALPEDFIGVIFANEVIDAMPVERIKKTPNGWHYQGVICGEEGFEWCELQPVESRNLPALILKHEDRYPEGYVTEIRPIAGAWIKSIADCLNSGVILLVDYGYPQNEYYHPQRVVGTLKCFSRHQMNDEPFERVGLQDITAHVDFTQLAQSAHDSGLQVAGFTTQAGFLLASNLLHDLTSENQLSTYKMSQQIQMLMTPGQMGEVVKVLQLAKNPACLATGFDFQDHLHRL
ncbi:class I SAM-dependent methyltransferase [Aliikangiella marina]|uniref:Class I SAM-dependent methyltransferase n=1 Tax=Aliikangiella marina TaxID=1712262 RepID=A0A545TCC9_9GAMM|nr:SAM-dependent methyltransferase [Aliikangiella marina]TQV74870.1 class I SAM-dependent methyltransferase [Aliikangiella marina]